MKTKALAGKSRRLGAGAVLGLLLAGLILVKARAGTEVTPGPGPAAALEALAQPAAANDVVTDCSKDEIQVGINYRGDRIEFFGTLGDSGADAVIVKLTSPAETVKLNQKGRVGPVWMNVKQHTVESVPFIYQISASDRLDQILSPELEQKLGIGFEALKERMVVHTTKGEAEPADAEIVFQGLLQLKQKEGLYKIDEENRIKIKQGVLFRHCIVFPAASKEGDYLVETYLFRQGRLLQTVTDTIHVQKVGLEAKLVRWAQERPKLYGLCAVVIALGAGLLVGFIFKGGGH